MHRIRVDRRYLFSSEFEPLLNSAHLSNRKKPSHHQRTSKNTQVMGWMLLGKNCRPSKPRSRIPFFWVTIDAVVRPHIIHALRQTPGRLSDAMSLFFFQRPAHTQQDSPAARCAVTSTKLHKTESRQQTRVSDKVDSAAL